MDEETASLKVTRPNSPWRHPTPLAVLLLGALSIVLLLWTSRASELQALEELRLDGALRGLKVAVSTAHLWLEEALTGDATIDVEGIWRRLDVSLAVVLQLVQSSGAREADVSLKPLKDPLLRERAQELRWRLVELRDLSFERYRQGGPAGAGSDLDQSFDQRFEELLESAESLRLALVERAHETRTAARRRLQLVVVAWAVLVVAAAAGLWRGETRRRRVESALQASRRQRERTRQALHQREAELRQAQRMESVGRLAGGIAHDINNYLGAVQGYCETVRLQCASQGELSAPMETASQILARASALIRQLLAFSRRQPARPMVIDLNRIIEGIREIMGGLLPGEIQLATDLQEDLWPVEIDPYQVEQILVNLLINSRDAMSGGGEIDIRTRRVDNPGGGVHPALEAGRYVLLSVRDSGSGMAPEVRERIFERFFTTKSEQGSSGLGLATVHDIVQHSGGLLTVDSRPGAGATFEIFFPASAQAAREPAPELAEASPATPPATVLLVEDNEPMRTSTAGLLRALGHRVVTAASGEEALELVASSDSPTDLVITDVVMPGIGGPELLRRVRRRWHGVGGLFLSGYTDTVILRRDLDQEDSDFLQKPFTAAALSRKIAQVLSTSEGAPGAVPGPGPRIELEA